MVLFNLISRRKQLTQIITLNSVGDTNTFQIDSTPSLTHNMTATITSNPIEDGSNVSDHVNIEPRRLTIEGFISNTPLTIQQSIATTFATAVLNQVTPPLLTGSLVSAFQVSTNRIQDAFIILEELMNNKVPFRVQTGLKLYENMIVSDISIPRNSENALRFTMNLQQIQVSQSEVVLIPETNLANNVKHTASSLQSEGKKSTNSVSTDTQVKGQSILRKIQGLL